MLHLVLDIEANKLHNPDKIWVVVCKDITSGANYVFRNITEDKNERSQFINLFNNADRIIGHNLLGYDLAHTGRLIEGITIDPRKCIDTYIISRMADYSRKSHSLDDFGTEFGYPKGVVLEDGSLIESKHFTQSFFDKYSLDLENYCKRDVEITHRVYSKYIRFINKEVHKAAIELEHSFQYYVVNALSDNGFAFNKEKANKLLGRVTNELQVLDTEITEAFPDKLKLIREVIPRNTKYGTLSLSSIPISMRASLHEIPVVGAFCYCKWSSFNPSSSKQVVSVLNSAGWSPVNKTKGHIETERAINITRNNPELVSKLSKLKIEGWVIDEENLATLPASAPKAARLLAKRIMLESRRRTLTEWSALVQEDGRIHGEFQGIGAWTQRMAHRKPNTANISNEFENDGTVKPYGKEFRQLWQAPKNRLLVGVDAEGIQLRIFAHLIDDPEFTRSLEEGKKEDKSDPHSLNQRILGPVCKTRQAAKRFVYALLLGGGIGKLTQILGCEKVEAEAALNRLLARYTGFAYLKSEVIPKDARRGWFTGLDGRSVPIRGETTSERRHRAMSGYLQNGEKVIMARASLKWINLLSSYDAKIVNLVHDEWQIECPNNMRTALSVAEIVSSSLNTTGEDLHLKCKLAGSYYNDDHKDYTIGTNWYQTH